MMWPAKVTRSCLIGLMRCVMYIACCMMDGVRGKNVAFNMKSVRCFTVYIHCESKILCNNCVKCEAIVVVPSLLYSVIICALGLVYENTFTTFTVFISFHLCQHTLLILVHLTLSPIWLPITKSFGYRNQRIRNVNLASLTAAFY